MNEITLKNMDYAVNELLNEMPRLPDALVVSDYAASLADELYNWISQQKYGEEALLHPAVCCDYVGMMRFKKKLTDIIEMHLREHMTLRG